MHLAAAVLARLQAARFVRAAGVVTGSQTGELLQRAHGVAVFRLMPVGNLSARREPGGMGVESRTHLTAVLPSGLVQETSWLLAW